MRLTPGDPAAIIAGEFASPEQLDVSAMEVVPPGFG
jgi:hypothetical protein